MELQNIGEVGGGVVLTPSYMNRGTKFIHRGKLI